nr:glycoside hydrolase family 16 protein [Methylobacterium sp. 37f]
MSQVGADTIIRLETGETLTLRDHKVEDLSAANFRLPVDLSKYQLTFSDEFNTFSGSATGVATTWQTKYPQAGLRTLPSNKEDEYYSDSSVGVNPFSVKDGVLDITAARATQGVETPLGSGLDWTSGVITTYKSFSQLYGYFEVRAQLPAGKGFWPAFWLLPADLSWPPELDVFEVLGDEPGTIYASTHSKVGGPNVTETQTVFGIDTSKGFHTYGVDWQADTITYYVDNNAVARLTTPSDMNKPMYMLLNLAVGDAGSWPGATDATTPAEGHMLIDYVRAYTTKRDATPVSPSLTPPDTGVPVTISAFKLAGLTRAAGGAADGELAGTASGGALVTIYDGNSIVATAKADDKTGAFAVTLKDLGAGSHMLTAKVGPTAVSNEVLIVVGTASSVVAQLPALQASGKLAAIYLSDSHVLPVASIAAMTSLLTDSKEALAAIKDGYSFAVTTTAGNNISVVSYDALGRMTSTATTSIVDGQVTRSVETKADGSSTTLVYAKGIVVSETHVHADRTKDVLLTNIVGKTYVAETNSYDAAGTLMSTSRTHSDGSKDWEFSFDKKTGIKTSTSFDNAGAVAMHTINSADKMVETKYVDNLKTSEYTYYTPGSADIAKLKIFTAGVLTYETVRHSDQTKDNYTFSLDGKSFAVKHEQIDATGKTVMIDLTFQDGSHAITGLKGNLTIESTAKTSDTLKGAGGDTFLVERDSGADTIVGFHPGSGIGHDVIAIDHSVATNMSQLALKTVGQDTVIQISATDSITLQGVSHTALTQDNFWFT